MTRKAVRINETILHMLEHIKDHLSDHEFYGIPITSGIALVSIISKSNQTQIVIPSLDPSIGTVTSINFGSGLETEINNIFGGKNTRESIEIAINSYYLSIADSELLNLSDDIL